MDALTLDQIQLFLAVVDEGSFSRASKRLNRAQSAVTYGIQKLEAQIGLSLFDRSAYRADRRLGPATQWLVDHLASLAVQSPSTVQLPPT